MIPTGDRWLTLKPLLLMAVVQVQTSDEENAWIMGPKWDSRSR
jgi:hypothetical protein